MPTVLGTFLVVQWLRLHTSTAQVQSLVRELGGFTSNTRGKEPTCQYIRHKRHRFDPWVGNIPWKWQPTPVFLPGETHEQRSLVGYSP